MFGNITDKFDSILRRIRGVGVITDSNINQAIRETRRTLIEADVNFKVVKKFIQSVQEKSKGLKVIKSIKPGQQFVKIMHDELIELLGGKSENLNLTSKPSVIVLAGLQGAGKTTTVGKLAYWLKENKKNPIMVAADTYRPGAIEQLKTIGENIDWFFEVYLYEKKYPTLIKNISHGSNHTFVELSWKNKGFAMPVEVFYKSNTGFTQKKLVVTDEPIMIAIPQYNQIKIDPDKRILLTLDKKE